MARKNDKRAGAGPNPLGASLGALDEVRGLAARLREAALAPFPDADEEPAAFAKKAVAWALGVARVYGRTADAREAGTLLAAFAWETRPPDPANPRSLLGAPEERFRDSGALGLLALRGNPAPDVGGALALALAVRARALSFVAWVDARAAEVEGAFVPLVEEVRREGGKRGGVFVRVTLAGPAKEVRLTRGEAELLAALARGKDVEARRKHVLALRRKLPELAPYIMRAGEPPLDVANYGVYALDEGARASVLVK